MPQASYPIAMIASVPVVTAPVEISASNADQLRIALLEAAARGTGTLVLEMTSTQLCDTSGCHVLERAYHRAVGSGGELRLITAGGAVPGELAAAGLGWVIPCYASLGEAVSLSPANIGRAPTGLVRPWPARYEAGQRCRPSGQAGGTGYDGRRVRRKPWK